MVGLVGANGTSLDIGTDKGRANQEAIDAIAQAAKEAAAATLEQTGSQEQANEVLQAGRDNLIASLKPFGIAGDAASAYADELGLVPVAKETAIKADTAAAREALRLFLIDLNNIPGRRDVVINQVVKQTGAARGAVGAAYATGGTVYGPGTGTSDSILAMVSAGEEITRAAMAEKHRPLLKAINEDRVPAWWNAPGFARGGTVGYASTPQYASNINYMPGNSGPSEVVLNGATLVVKDVNGQLIGRMQVEADQRIQVAGNDRRRSIENGYRQ